MREFSLYQSQGEQVFGKKDRLKWSVLVFGAHVLYNPLEFPTVQVSSQAIPDFYRNL